MIAEILIWSLLAASVNLLLGYVGLLSFGQALYFGFGMYGVAMGISQFGLGLWPAFFLGIAAATAMAAVAGAIAVRLTWHYFAIITVVFSLIFYFVAMSAKSIHRRRRRIIVQCAAAVEVGRMAAYRPHGSILLHLSCVRRLLHRHGLSDRKPLGDAL